MTSRSGDQGALSKGLRLGPLDLRLVDSEAELQAVQRLRFRVFYKEMKARPTPRMTELERDFDTFDDICEHLIVRDTTRDGDDAVVATMRLLRRSTLGRRVHVLHRGRVRHLPPAGHRWRTGGART